MKYKEKKQGSQIKHFLISLEIAKLVALRVSKLFGSSNMYL